MQSDIEIEANEKFERILNETCPSNCTVHCKGLRGPVSETLLREVFSPFGEIEDITMFCDHSDYAFIRFNTKEAATLAICSIDDQEVNGFPVKCNWARRHVPNLPEDNVIEQNSYASVFESIQENLRDALRAIQDMNYPSLRVDQEKYDRIFNLSSPNNRTVHIKGLDESFTDSIVREAFIKFGTIESISLFVDYDKDYGFVCFCNKEDATRAICLMDGTHLNGCLIYCNWSHRADERFEGLSLSPSSISTRSSSESSIPSASNTLSDISTDAMSRLCIATNASTSATEEASVYRAGNDPFVGVDQASFDRVFNQSSPYSRTVYIKGLDNDITEYMVHEAFSRYGTIESISLYVDYDKDYGFVCFSTKEEATRAICLMNDKYLEGCFIQCNWSHRQSFDVATSPPPTVPISSSLDSSTPSASNTVSDIPTDSNSCIDTDAPTLSTEGASGGAKLKKDASNYLCKICMDEELNMVFIPCGHMISCVNCAKKIYTCPICRKAINSKIRTYMS